MQKPSLGRQIIARVDPKMNNGSDTAPATITRVWSEQPDGSWLVNFKATFDSSGADLWCTSARLFDTEVDARALPEPTQVAFWPPRV